MNNIDRIKIWEYLQKQITIKQLPNLENKVILDFGAGNCYLPSLLSDTNKFVCIEPFIESYPQVYSKENIRLIKGDVNLLKGFQDNSFDVIFCHNVFEYMNDQDRQKAMAQFERILKKDGFISFIKHNKFGRILEQVLFKNKFDNYKSIFIENESHSERFGNIAYFKDKNLTTWSNNKLMIVNKFGLRTFYDLQPNMELQQDSKWQNKIIELEMFFSKTPEFINISFLHHLILIKK